MADRPYFLQRRRCFIDLSSSPRLRLVAADVAAQKGMTPAYTQQELDTVDWLDIEPDAAVVGYSTAASMTAAAAEELHCSAAFRTGSAQGVVLVSVLATVLKELVRLLVFAGDVAAAEERLARDHHDSTLSQDLRVAPLWVFEGWAS